jgi:hypothetical protein
MRAYSHGCYGLFALFVWCFVAGNKIATKSCCDFLRAVAWPSRVLKTWGIAGCWVCVGGG